MAGIMTISEAHVIEVLSSAVLCLCCGGKLCTAQGGLPPSLLMEHTASATNPYKSDAYHIHYPALKPYSRNNNNHKIINNQNDSS